MSWLVFAFLGPVLWAVSTHLDKYLVDRYFKDSNIAVLLIFTALIGLFTLPFIWFFEPKGIALSIESAGLMGLSGILYMGAMLLYLGALQSEEASVVAPFFQAAPLFAYLLGYFFLGEDLSSRQIAGGVLIVSGTLLASLRSEPHASRFKSRLAALMLACAFVLALSSLIFKVFALRDEFWPTTFWMYVGEAIFGVGLLAVLSIRRQFVALMRSSPGAVLSINGVNELINLGGGLGTRYALLLAPLSLVQAISSTTTLFVFAFGIALSICCPALGRENMSGGELMRKGGAALLVAVGVLLISA
jgi:uncharacterized membrane protein